MIANQSKHLIQKYNAYLILDKILFNLSPNTYFTFLISIGNSDITLRSPPNVNTNCFPMNFKCQELINVISDQRHKHAAANHIVFSIQIYGPDNQIISTGQLKINPCQFLNSEMVESKPVMIDLSNTNSPLMIFASFSLVPYQENPPQHFSIFKSLIQPISVVQQNRINIEPDNLSNLLSDYAAFSDSSENIDDSPIYNRKNLPTPNNNEINYNRPREYQEQMDPKINNRPFEGQNTPIPQLNHQMEPQPTIQRDQLLNQQQPNQPQLNQQQVIQPRSIQPGQQLNQQQIIPQTPKSPPIQIQPTINEQPPSPEINKTPIQQIQQQEPVISTPIIPNTNQQIPVQNETQPLIQLPSLIDSIEPVPVETQNENQDDNSLSNELTRLQEQMRRNEEIIKLMMTKLRPEDLSEIAALIPEYEFPSIEQPTETENYQETDQIKEKVQQETEQVEQTKEENQQEQAKENEIVQEPEVVEPTKERDPIFNELEEISQSLENANRVFSYLQTIPPDILLQVIPPFEDDETPEQQIEPQENVDNNEQQPKEATEQIQENQVTSTIPEEPKTMAQLKEELNELEAILTNNVKCIFDLLQMIPPEVLVEVLNGMPPLEFDEPTNSDTTNEPIKNDTTNESVQQNNTLQDDISSIQQIETPTETTDNTPIDNSQIDSEEITPENATNEQKENIENTEQKNDYTSNLNQEIDLLAHSAADTEQAIRNIIEIVPPDVLTEVMQNMPLLNMEESSDIAKETPVENMTDLNMTQRIPLNIISEIQTQLANDNASSDNV